MTNLTQFSAPRLQKQMIDLSFKIIESVNSDKFQDPPPLLPRGRHKCMFPYKTPSEIIALNILRNIEFKHSTY